jgi:hypothetical protein
MVGYAALNASACELVFDVVGGGTGAVGAASDILLGNVAQSAVVTVTVDGTVAVPYDAGPEPSTVTVHGVPVNSTAFQRYVVRLAAAQVLPGCCAL